MEHQDVFVSGDSIVAIAPTNSLGVKEDRVLIDGKGKYLFPGLIDMHLHLSKKWELDLLLQHGITSVRHMNGGTKVLNWADSVQKGLLKGPNIHCSSPWIHRIPEIEQYGFRIILTEEEARDAVREFHAQGYPFIKIAELDTEPFKALMKEADKLNYPVTGHIPNYEKNLEMVFASGMRSVEHLMELFWVYFDTVYQEDKVASFVQMIEQSGTANAPILIREEIGNQMFDDPAGFMTEEMQHQIEAFYGQRGVDNLKDRLERYATGESTRKNENMDALLKLTKAMNDGGVKLLIGTDSGAPERLPGITFHKEMALFRKAGLSNEDILKCATVQAAQVMGQDRLGSLGVGQLADLILVEKNPFEDLSTLSTPTVVLVGGDILYQKEE